MKCPHCLVEFHDVAEWDYIVQDSDCHWAIESYRCPNPKCRRAIVYLVGGDAVIRDSSSRFVRLDAIRQRILVRPKGSNRPPAPPEVPASLVEDYMEACLVLPDSAKASAALSRRCLQNLLREAAGIKPGNLADEIQAVIDAKALPSHLAGALDMVRVVGNFAAHPTKSKASGEIIPVEPQEAGWNLDVLEGLFDFFFVQPAKMKQKKDAVNAKLKDAGKKELK